MSVCKVLVQNRGVVTVSRDNRKVTYLTDDEASQLSEWSEETGKSESALLREAVIEYLDNDRSSRVESKVNDLENKMDEVLSRLDDGDTHTHKDQTPMKSGTDATEKARQIVRRLQSNCDNPDGIIQDETVDRAIEDIAGVDPRTIRKYKRLFRKRGTLFEHPGEPPIWTTESSEWLSWIQEYASLNGASKAEEIVEKYPASISTTGDGHHIELAQDPELDITS